MIKYEFMRAHGKGSEGSEKRGGCENKKGVRKKGGCTQHRHPPPPVYAPEDLNGKLFAINERRNILNCKSKRPIDHMCNGRIDLTTD